MNTQAKGSGGRLTDVLLRRGALTEAALAAAEAALDPGERIERVLDSKADIVDEVDAASPAHLSGDLTVTDLTYQYPDSDRNVLEHVSFSVKQGETLGIVGRTGSGKTTLMNLLLRMLRGCLRPE